MLDELIHSAHAWGLGQKYDAQRTRELRHQVLLDLHAHYLQAIPLYRRIAQEAGIGKLTDLDPILQNLMLTDDIFKSYDLKWLDEGDFSRMNAWLAQIFAHPVDIDVSKITSIGEWIDCLQANGIRLLCSSGTSGRFSFIPRDPETWSLHKFTNTGLAAAILWDKKIGPAWQRLAIRSILLHAPQLLRQPRANARLADYDAVFLDFAKGRTGNQTLEQELAPFFHAHAFLYNVELTPSVVRILARGPASDAERTQVSALQEQVVARKEENFGQVTAFMRQAAQAGRKLFMFGAGPQYKELCEYIAAQSVPLALPPGSLALFGGGWKSFSGEKLSPEKMVKLLSDTLALPPERIMEGYSMTEINAFMFRCSAGRFHIPLMIEPVIFNDALEPLSGGELHGIIGFLDPLARAYPGFIISGDEVHYIDGLCPCGKSGPAVTSISRAQAREVKGCGGIMASLQA